MRFYLDHSPADPGFRITHRDPLVLAGSCFSEHMGARLQQLRFKVYSSPGGNLFHPLSISNNLLAALEQQAPRPEHLLERDGVFFSYHHHSSVHGEGQRDLLHRLNRENQTTRTALQESAVLLLTFGTAFVYEHRELGIAVANCHKQPAKLFEKRLLQVREIVEAFTHLLECLRSLNPALRVVFTVSPVRYLKDGLEANSRSKATLLLAVNELVTNCPGCSYFPAYELVSEDLRDYRFYKEDLAHPSDQAVAYVWNKFAHTFFTAQTQKIVAEVEALNQALGHRQLIQNSAEALKLNAYIQRQKELIHGLAPEIDFNH